MIFNLYEAHQVMNNRNYTLDEKVEELQKLGLSEEQATQFFYTYIEINPDIPFKFVWQKDDE